MPVTPLPGRTVRGSTTGRPLYALFELIARRWTLRIVWELRDEPLPFAELRSRCDHMSTSTLSVRLRELAEAGLVIQNDTGYALTQLGHSLPDSLQPLIAWSDSWAAELGAASPSPPDGTPAQANTGEVSLMRQGGDQPEVPHR